MGWRIGSSWPRAALQDRPSLYLNQTGGAPRPSGGKVRPPSVFPVKMRPSPSPFQSFTTTIAARTEGGVEGPVGPPGERAGVGAYSSEERALGLRCWRPEGTNRGQRPGQ